MSSPFLLMVQARLANWPGFRGSILADPRDLGFLRVVIDVRRGHLLIVVVARPIAERIVRQQIDLAENLRLPRETKISRTRR